MTKTTVSTLKQDIDYIKKAVDDGFKGIHSRQDIANGTLLKHSNRIIELNSEVKDIHAHYLTKEDMARHNLDRASERLQDAKKTVWYVLGIIASMIVGYLMALFTGGL